MQIELFISKLKDHKIDLSSKQVCQFYNYYQTLIEWNKKFNLTRITKLEDVYLKHFFDSITPSFYFSFNQQRLCDVGAGAGFPSLPLKICFPQLDVTIVDSIHKRINFLHHLIDKLELDNVTLIHASAEDFAQNAKFRESFDISISRAVAKLPILSELCLPLLKKNGTFISLKASNVSEEIITAKRAIKVLGGCLENNYKLFLPIENNERHIVVIKKIHNTPNKFPRKAGVPNREPIV